MFVFFLVIVPLYHKIILLTIYVNLGIVKNLLIVQS
nr:MAG TPA: hypothetical protein [Caudoviricetes sp.]